MQYGYFDQPLRILLQFRGALNLVSPDPGTDVTIDVLGDDGSPIAGLSQTLNTITGTQYLFNLIPTARPTPDTVVLRREVRATFKYQVGLPGETRVPYTLIPYMSHGATPEDVRGYLGVTLVEMPDVSIDINAASLRALWDLGPSFTAALSATGQTRESARMVVILQAAQELLPSIKMRVAQQIVDGTRQFTRFSNADIERFIRSTAEDYSYHKLLVTGGSEDPLGFFATTTQADPFTG